MWKLAAGGNVFLLQPSQPTLCKVLRLVRAKTQSQGIGPLRSLSFHDWMRDGASGGFRSRDLPLTRRVLLAVCDIYRLSYRGTSRRRQELSLFKIKFTGCSSIYCYARNSSIVPNVSPKSADLFPCFIIGSLTKSATSTTVRSMEAPIM